jgi:acetyltransferase-like isoleucine patch superfamily enzyme
MKKFLKAIVRPVYRLVDRLIFHTLVSLVYKSYPKSASNMTLLRMAFFQKVIGFNRRVPWPVHFSSQVGPWKNITKGKETDPGYSIGNYIQADNGIIFGSNIRFGPNVVIVSANHDLDDYDKHVKTSPIKVGSNVWIGANSVILPGVTIGDNVVIGAGSIVKDDIPDNSIAAGNPCRVIKEKPPYQGESYD